MPPAGAQDAADREHQRRLAGAVRAEQRRDLAGRDLSETSCRTVAPAAGDGQVLDPQRERARRPSSLIRCPRCRGRPRSTCSSRSTSAVGPEAISLPKSSTAVISQHADTRLMSWSTRITSAPMRSGIAPDDLAELLRLLVREPGRRLVEQHDTRLADDRSRHLDEASLASAEPADLLARQSPRGRRTRAPRARRRCRDERRPPECSWIIATLSNTESSLDRLLLLERPPQPPARPAVVGHAQQVLAERADPPAAGVTNPLSTLKNVVLPAPFGPIRPQVPSRKRRSRRRAASRHRSGPSDRRPRSRRSPAPSLRQRLGDQPARASSCLGEIASTMPSGAVTSTCRTPIPKRTSRKSGFRRKNANQSFSSAGRSC